MQMVAKGTGWIEPDEGGIMSHFVAPYFLRGRPEMLLGIQVRIFMCFHLHWQEQSQKKMALNDVILKLFQIENVFHTPKANKVLVSPFTKHLILQGMESRSSVVDLDD